MGGSRNPKISDNIIYVWKPPCVTKSLRVMFLMKVTTPERGYVHFVSIQYRTAINVLGDAIGAGIVYHLSKDELDSLNDEAGNVETPAENGSAKVWEPSFSGRIDGILVKNVTPVFWQ